MKLPCKLQASPLKEVIFEIRQEADLPLALMAPGLLFGPELAGMPILNMPANQIPADIRENDPNLKYSALINIKKNNLNLYIGNKSVAFSLSDGYAGWTSFRNLVLPYVYNYRPYFEQSLYKNTSMTFHSSKGLEFDQVILFVTDYPLNTPDSICNHYVAATRARYKLILILLNQDKSYRYLNNIKEICRLRNINIKKVINFID